MNEQTQNNQHAEEQAGGTLQPIHDREPLESKPTKNLRLSWEFALGFVGWWLIYSLLLYVKPAGSDTFTLGILMFPIQGIALLILFLVKALRSVAWGMLLAIGVNLLISIMLGLLFNALCFVPFLFPLY